MPSNASGLQQENYTKSGRIHATSTFWRGVLGGVLWLVAYGVSQSNSLLMLGSKGISLWYLPAGVAMGAAIALGRGAGLAILAASALKDLCLGNGPLEYAHDLRHVLVYTSAGLVFRRLNGQGWPFDQLRSSGAFVATALLAAVAAAVLGITLNGFFAGSGWNAALQALPAWIIGDAVGTLTIAPVMVLAFGPARGWERVQISLRSASDSIGFVVLCNALAFGLPVLFPDMRALWFVVIVAPAAIAVIYGSAPAMVAIAATNLLFPPLAGLLDSDLDRFEQQLFVLMISLTGLLLSGAIGERDRALLALKDRERTLEQEIEARTQEIKLNSERHVQVLASLSHDLRQPIQALSLYLEVLASIPLPEAARGPAARAALMAARLRDLVQKVLGLSREDPGARDPIRRTFPIQESLDRLSAALAPLASEQQVELTFIRSSLAVESDPVLLDRILGNLIENALRHSCGDRVLIGCRRRGDRAILHVIDDGQGFGLSLNRMTDNAASPIGSLGLGLRIITETAMALGHPVEFLPGRHGAHVTLALPKAEPSSATTREDAASAGRFLSGCALVVEDDPQVRDALALVLQNAGMTVATAASQNEALSKIASREHQPDLLILDYHFAGGCRGTDIYQLAERIVGQPLPTIFITGSTDPRDMAALRAQGWPVLGKPVSAERLIEAALAMTAKQSSRPPSQSINMKANPP